MQDGYEYTSVFKGDTKTNRDWWNERHMPCRAGNLYSSPTVCCYKREFLIFQDKSEIKIFKWNLKMILRQLLIQNISICLCRSPSSYLQSERWTSPHISLWTFEDRHWISRDIFSSRSMPPPSLTLWYISVPNAWLSWMASWLALICLKKKKFPKVQDWERYKEPYRGSDWLDGPAILWLHSIFSFGLLFQDPLFVVSL